MSIALSFTPPVSSSINKSVPSFYISPSSICFGFTPTLTPYIRIHCRINLPLVLHSTDGGSFDGHGGGKSFDGHGGSGGDNEEHSGKNDALLVLAQAGRSLENMPADQAAAIKESKTPASIVTWFLELEKSPILRWLLQFAGFNWNVFSPMIFSSLPRSALNAALASSPREELCPKRKERQVHGVDSFGVDSLKKNKSSNPELMLGWVSKPATTDQNDTAQRRATYGSTGNDYHNTKDVPESQYTPLPGQSQSAYHKKSPTSITRPTYLAGISSSDDWAIEVNFEKSNGKYILQLTRVPSQNTMEEKALTAALLFLKQMCLGNWETICFPKSEHRFNLTVTKV